ncbi:MAG: NAD-dependent epimerase/dehydratase family protein, partial [Syntrophobacterales bacterium]
MSRTIALTGATGFIGGALARRLETIGWQIRALVRPASLGDRYSENTIRWIEGDLGDFDSLRRLVNNVYTVVHCAGAVRGATQAQFDGVNVDGVARLVQAVREQHQMPRFLLISSLAAREPHLSPYAASKRQGEDTLATAAGDMNWAVLRPPAVYGPGDKELLPLFHCIGKGIAPVLGPRSARFSLLYVEDLAEAVGQWLRSETKERRAFALHDGHPDGYSWDDVVDTVARLYDRHVFRIQVPVSILRL